MKRWTKSLGRTLATRPQGGKPRGPLPRNSLPRRWLVTDAHRLADPLPAIGRLRPGDGVLFRHYEWPPVKRLAFAQQVAALCRRRGLVLLVAGDVRLALAVGADGLHLPQALIAQAAAARRAGLRLVTAAVHDPGAVALAARSGIDAVLISPVFATASHPGVVGLGVLRFAGLATAARRQGVVVYALGGMTAAGMHRLRHTAAIGFAAIAGLS